MIPDPADVVVEVDLHALWQREWWAAASTLMSYGYDVIVLDPEVSEPETWSDGDAVVQVYPTRAPGWQLQVHQAEADPIEEYEP